MWFPEEWGSLPGAEKGGGGSEGNDGCGRDSGIGGRSSGNCGFSMLRSESGKWGVLNEGWIELLKSGQGGG